MVSICGRKNSALLKSEVVGHQIYQHGRCPNGPTLDAIKRAKVPSNVTELRSFIGMVNHYGRFIKQLFTKPRLLHNLLCSDVQ